MRPIRLPLPLPPRCPQARLLPTPRHQLADRAPTINSDIATPALRRALHAHLRAQRLGRRLVDAKVLVDYNTVVLRGAVACDEAAMDFEGYGGGRAQERVAEAAATPGDVFEDVACFEGRGLGISFGFGFGFGFGVV